MLGGNSSSWSRSQRRKFGATGHLRSRARTLTESSLPPRTTNPDQKPGFVRQPLYGGFKPSPGLEPGAASLPWRIRGAARPRGNGLNSTLSLQVGWLLASLLSSLKDPETPRQASNLSPEPSPNG